MLREEKQQKGKQMRINIKIRSASPLLVGESMRRCSVILGNSASDATLYNATYIFQPRDCCD